VSLSVASNLLLPAPLKIDFRLFPTHERRGEM
jgi:hypothetical protein